MLPMVAVVTGVALMVVLLFAPSATALALSDVAPVPSARLLPPLATLFAPMAVLPLVVSSLPAANLLALVPMAMLFYGRACHAYVLPCIRAQGKVLAADNVFACIAPKCAVAVACDVCA